MATETHIPESVYLKIGEKEDNALSSEILEEKVIELVGNKVKHVESSRQVAETENTQVEAGIPTNESGTFFQALSVPMVSSNTPESFDAATTKDQDPKFVKTSESVEEITPSVEIKNEGLHDGITTDVCVLTKTESKAETIENEEKNVEKAFEKEACEETGTEKDESAVGLKFSDSMAPSKQEGDRDGVTSTPDETCEDIKETTTTVAGIKEQDLNEMPKEFVKQETEDKSIDTQEAIEQWESVKKIEQEEETEEIKPSVEIEEKMDAITTDACISTQIKSQVENTEHEEMDEEKATQSDDGQKEKSGIPSVKDVCKDNSSEKVEYENSGIKLNDEEREQVVNVLEKDQGEDVVTSAQDVSFEGNEREVVTGKESIEEDTKETRSSVETTDVCSSTQTKPEEETTKKEEKNDEETIESDDGQTKKSGSHMVKEVCEETFSEMTESEEGLKPSESSSMVLTENEIERKDEDQEMEQELYVSEKDQTESQVKTTKLGGHAEVTESDDGQKENSESILIKEVCEETNYEKVESERVELSDSSGIKQNEKAITTLSNDEVQEKEQDQDEDDITWHDGTNADVCVSTQAELEKETKENEDKNDAKPIQKEVCEETSPEKAESEVVYQLSDSMVPSKKEDLNTVEKDKCDSDGVTSSQDTTCEDIKETTPDQFAATVADFKEQDLNEFLKEEIEDKSTDAQQASEECQNGENDKTEQKPEESVKHEDQENEQEVNILEKDQVKDDFTSTQDVSVEGGLQEKTYHVEDIEREIVKERESIKEDTQEIKSSAETPKKTEQHRLINAVSTDVCISTQTEPNETTETQEKNDEEAIESDDGQTKKPGIPMVEEICEETVLEKHEKAESEEGLKLSNSTSMVLNENEIMSKAEYQVQELYLSEKDQSGGNDVTISQNESNEDIKETTIGHVTAVADLEEEAEDKAIDAQEASEQYEDRANDNKEQNFEDSVKDIVHSFSKIEHEEYTEEIKPSVETNEEKNVYISTQTKSQEEATKNEEKAIEYDNDLKEKFENPFVKEVHEGTDLKKTESEEEIKLSDSSKMNLNEKAVEIISKDEDQENEQEPAVFEDELQGNNNDGECNELKKFQIRESIKGDNEDIRASVETEEIMEQQGSLHDITSDVSILTQKESQEDTTKNEEKNEEPIESDDGWKEKHDIPSVEEVCEETSLEKVEPEEGLELHDSLNMKINEKTITFKDEDHEKDQEVNTPEEVQEKDNVTSSHDAISKEEEDLQQKNHNESNEPEFFKTRENVDEEIKSSVEKKENSEQQGFSHVTSNDVCSSTQAKEETIKNEARLDAENQADSTEDKSEMEDEVVSTVKANEQYEDRANNNREQNPEDSVKDIVHSFSKIEHEEYTEEIKPSVETNEEKNVCISTQTESQEEATKNEEKAIEGDDDLKEKSENPFVKEVREETDLKKTESEEEIKLSDTSEMNLNEKAVEIISKDEDQEKEQESAVFEDELQGNNNDGECNELKNFQIRESIKGDNEDIRASVETEEIMEQQGSLHDITSDVSLLTQKESQEDTTKNEEKNEEPIESDDGWKEKHDIPSVEEGCEETSLEKVESEEGLELHDNLNMKINEKTITFKDEDHEKDQEVNTPEEVQDKDNVTSSHDAISKEEEDLQQKNYHNESNESEFFKTRENVDEEIKSSVEKRENSEQQGFSHVTTNDVCSSTQAKEEKIKNEARLDAENQADSTEDKSEMEDEAVLTEKMSSEEQNGEEIEACLTETTEVEVTKKDEDSSHISIQDTNDGTTKEEKCFLYESRDIEISTLEHEPTEEQNSGLDKVSKENFTDLNETTAVEPQDTPSSSLEPSTKDTSNSEKAKAESEILPIEDLESVTEIQIPDVVPKSEDSKLISVRGMHLDEEKETVPEENSSDEKTEQPTQIKKETFEEVIEKCENGDKNKREEKPAESDKLEDQEKEQEVHMLENDQGEDEITRAQDMAFEGGVEDRNHHSEGNEHEVVKTKERIVEDVEEIRSSVEAPDRAEQQRLINVTPTDVCISTQTEPEEKTTENEEKNDEKAICQEIVSEKVETEEGGEDDFQSSKNASNEDINESTHDQYATTVANFEEEKGESVMTEEIIREKAEDNSIDAQEMSSDLGQPKEQNLKIRAFLTTTTNEKTEDEITKKDEDSSHESMDDTNDNTIKEEKCTLEHEPVEEQNGRRFDEVSKENLMDLYDTTAVKHQEDVTPSGTLGTLTEDTSNSEKAKAESEVLPIGDLESVSEIQIPEVVPNLEDSNLIEGFLISATAMHVDEEKETVRKENSSDEKTEQTTEIKQEPFEKTSSEKAGSEGFKISDSSNMEINEKVITTFNDEDQEKGQEVNISAEGQGMDNVTNAQDANFEEDLQEKNYQNKDNEHKFVETRESIDEDTKEIISSVETKELKSESPFFTEVCEATSSEIAEPEDGVKHSESFNMKVVDEIVSKEENLEKKQELTMSEVQDGRDDVIISDNISNEDIKETTTGQRATTVVDFEEGQDLSATTKEILVEEAAEDKSVDAQEASEPFENEGKDKSEQNPEESVDKPVKSCVEDRREVKDEFVSTEKMPSEHGEPKEQNIEEIEACLTETVNEKTEDEITKKEEDSSHESIEDPNDNTTRQEKRPLEYEPAEEQHGGLDEVSKENLTNLYETTAVEPQEDITPSNSLATSTEDASAKAESENLPIEDLESVSQVQIPEVVPKSADVKAKEECLMSEAATKEILSDENPEAYGERELTFESTDDDHINETIQQADKSYITTEENVSRLGQIGDNDSPYEKRDTEEDGTQENQLNSTEECGEMLKDAFLTEKISYSDPIPVTNREVTQVRVDTQIGQEDLQATEDISRESYVKNDSMDEAPKKEIIPSLEEVKTIEPEVNLSNIESTAYPSESEKLPTPALEYVCDVQAREISADSEDREVKEECIVLATAQYTDENRVEEEEKNNTNEILSVLAEENVMQVPEEKSYLNREEKASTEESLEQHGELKPASESIIEEDKVNKIEAQPEQSDIASENIMNDQESKLEHMTEKDLEDGKRDMEEDLTLAPENQIKSIENHNDIMKNVILTDEDDKRLTELDKTSTSTLNQKELANEIELSKPILVENTKVTELKAESQIELENIQPAEVKDVSVDEPLKDEIIQVLEDGKALELQVNLPEIESRDTPSNEQDSMPCSTQETVEEKGVRVSQLTDRELSLRRKKRMNKLLKQFSQKSIQKQQTTHVKHLSVENQKLISMVPPEGNTSPTVEDQANELVPETDKTEVEHSSICSNTDQNPKFTEEGFTETFSEDQTSIKERYIEVERKGNFAVANKEEKSGNEVVEDVIVREVLLEDETAKESKNIKDNINEEAIHNQLTSATDEVCENERSNSSPDEVVEKKDLVGDTEDPKLMAENLNLKDESFTVMKASKEDSDLVAPEFESLEKMATEEKIIETDAYEEKETLEVRSEGSRGHGDMIKLEEKTNEVSEIVPEGRREASAVLSENLQEDSPKMILAKHDPEITTATAKIEDKKTGELQVSTLNYETDEGKQNAPGDMQNKEREIVQPQESSEDNTLLSQNDNKIDDSLVLPSVENNTKQGVDTRFEEAPVIDVLKHEKGLDHTTEVKSVDVASNAECSEIELLHIDTKETTSELINQENQKESDDNIEALIPIEDVKSSTKVKSADLEVLSVMDPNNKKDEAYEAEKGVLNGEEHLESTGDRSKSTEEFSGMKQELDAPVTLGIGATDDLKISQKNLTDDLTKISETQPEIQKYEASAACTVDKQSPNEKTAMSLIAEVQDLNAIKASNTLPQCSSEDFKEEEKMSDQKDMSPEPTKVNSEVADQNIIGEREVVLTKDEKVDKEEIGEENEEEEDNEKTGDAPVMVEASKDMEVKVHKKSHNILSGVGSKVKHSIAKVKKAITGKSSHQKPPSP